MFRIKKAMLLVVCLQICSCSQNDKNGILIDCIYDDFNNKNLNVVENKCDIVPYYCYTIDLLINKSYAKEDQLADILDNVKIKYDKNDITLIYPNSLKIVENNYALSFRITATKSFDASQIEFTYRKRSIKYFFKTIEKKYSIGTTKIHDLSYDVEEYLSGLQYYDFEEKERLVSVDKELYQAFDTGIYLKNRKTILIKTKDVKRFLFDSIYLPENVNEQSAVTYNGKLFDFDDPSENDTDYALFNSKNTGRYPLVSYSMAGEAFNFYCVNDKDSLLKKSFFETNKESFFTIKINGIDFYLWEKKEVYVPSYYLVTDDINIFFSRGDYSYIISKKASISAEQKSGYMYPLLP